MKKSVFVKMILPIFLCAVLLGLSGCSSEQSYSFGPNDDVSGFSSEYKADLQEKLNAAGNAPAGLSYYGYQTKFDDQGQLIVDGFFRNRTGDTITDLKCTITIMVDLITVAYGEFNIPESEFGTLKSGDSRPWTLIFTAEDVLAKDQDLSKYDVKVEATYKRV